MRRKMDLPLRLISYCSVSDSSYDIAVVEVCSRYSYAIHEDNAYIHSSREADGVTYLGGPLSDYVSTNYPFCIYAKRTDRSMTLAGC